MSFIKLSLIFQVLLFNYIISVDHNWEISCFFFLLNTIMFSKSNTYFFFNLLKYFSAETDLEFSYFGRNQSIFLQDSSWYLFTVVTHQDTTILIDIRSDKLCKLYVFHNRYLLFILKNNPHTYQMIWYKHWITV